MTLDEAMLLALGRGVLILAVVVFLFWSLIYALLLVTTDDRRGERFVPEYSTDRWGWRLATWTPAVWLGVVIALVGWWTR